MNRRHDFIAILTLILLWFLFFWRLFTWSSVDGLSLKEGDFSGQFVAWTAYSVERIGDGELPLWNPYMNAGSPFMADPQTAVFYPPRLLTVGLLSTLDQPDGGDIYRALQTEMALHVLLGLLAMYAFLRQLTGSAPRSASVAASIGGALVFGFGGYMSAYPQLQIPILETAVWMPLVLLGIYRATVVPAKVRWYWLLFASVITAVALLAGHPQTLLFLAYGSLAYLIYRLWGQPWQRILISSAVYGGLAAGLSAVQWIPTADFQRYTYRGDISFAERGGGFGLQELAQMIFPDMLGFWNPLYIGLIGLILALIAIWQGKGRFWLGMGLIALVLSFGARLVSYHLSYLLIPGMSFFRGQERIAFLVAVSGSVLVSLGIVEVLSWQQRTHLKPVTRLHLVLGTLTGLLTAILLIQYLGDSQRYLVPLNAASFALILTALSALFFHWVPDRRAGLVLLALIIFDLFSVNMPDDGNFDSILAADRLPTPAYADTVRENLDIGQRVEAGLVGFPLSYASLYGVRDIWGNSPLRYDSMEFFLWDIPFDRRWELLGVQLVLSESDTAPIAFTHIGEGTDFSDGRHFNILKLDDPRPFAHMVYQVTPVDDEQAAREQVKSLAYPAREGVLLEADVPDLPDEDGSYTVDFKRFEPEDRELMVETTVPGILTLALPYDNGWQVEVDGEPSDLLRAYGGLSAVYLPEGKHIVNLRYQPLGFQIGRIISILSLIGLVAGVVLLRRTEVHYG